MVAIFCFMSLYSLLHCQVCRAPIDALTSKPRGLIGQLSCTNNMQWQRFGCSWIARIGAVLPRLEHHTLTSASCRWHVADAEACIIISQAYKHHS
ncbi:hypothetical protein JOM56_013253 [Amanita muscaria]